jgi:hypothetical protein
MGFDTRMGVLGASGNALYCMPVSVTLSRHGPNGLSVYPRAGAVSFLVES